MAGKVLARAAQTATGRRRGSGAATTTASTGAIVPPIAGGSQETNLDAALHYHHEGWAVVPLCHPDDNGACACGRRYPKDYPDKNLAGRPWPHEGAQIGKAPRFKDYQTKRFSEQELRAYWLRHPQANVGAELAQSGKVMVDPDSPRAWAESLRLGIKNGRPRVSKNTAFLFDRTDGCAIARVVHQGESGNIDVLSFGIAVLHGRHREGHSVQLLDGEMAPAPRWAVDMLNAAGDRQHAAAVDIGGDLPEVNVDHLIVSDRIKRLIRQGPDAEPETYKGDRSGAQFSIVNGMIAAGYDDKTIAGVLMDPNNRGGDKAQAQGLDWLAVDIGRAHTKPAPEAGPPLARGSIPQGGQLHHVTGVDVAGLVVRIEQLEAQVKALVDERLKLLAVQRNPNIKQERNTALAITFAVESATSRGQADSEGWVRVSRHQIAELAGVSKKTVSEHAKRLQTWGIIEKETRIGDKRLIHPETGEILAERPTELWVRLTAEAPETLDRLAVLKPERASWGGRRLQCPQHPDADIIIATSYLCSTCGRDVKSPQSRRVHPGFDYDAEDPRLHDVTAPPAEEGGDSNGSTWYHSHGGSANTAGGYTCLDCGAPLPPGRQYRCVDCVGGRQSAAGGA